MARRAALLSVFVLGIAGPVTAVDAGKAAGVLTIDGATIQLAVAVETRKENLFDEKKQDTVIVIADRPLSPTRPDDEIELSMRARRGDLAVLTLRIDGTTLVNVTVAYKGLSGLAILPGSWFQYTPGKPNGGALKLAKRDFDGHAYAVDVEFAAARAGTPRQAPPPSPPNAPGRR